MTKSATESRILLKIYKCFLYQCDGMMRNRAITAAAKEKEPLREAGASLSLEQSGGRRR